VKEDKIQINQENKNQQMTFNLPEFDDRSYSVKSDILANAVLGSQIKTTYKRAFEGLLSKMTTLDINAYIKEDKPLRVSLSPKEYQQRFPRERNIKETFRETARYYQKNSSLEIIYPNDAGNDGKEEYINVVDTATIRPSGEIEILFTRGILPHLNDVRGRLLIMNIDEFGKLTGKYSQKIFEIFSAWLSKDIVSNRVEIEWLRTILKVPQSYNFSRFKKQILDISIKDIHEHTQLQITILNIEKQGRSFKYIHFSLSNNEQEIDLINKNLDLVTNQFRNQGITDEMFNDLKSRRESLGLTFDQPGMNASCKILIKISEMEHTHDLETIFDITISSKWKSYKAEYYRTELEYKKKPIKTTDLETKVKPASSLETEKHPDATFNLEGYMQSNTFQIIKDKLKKQLDNDQYINWIEVLTAYEKENELLIISPSGFVHDWIKKTYYKSIENIALKKNPSMKIILKFNQTGVYTKLFTGSN